MRRLTILAALSAATIAFSAPAEAAPRHQRPTAQITKFCGDRVCPALIESTYHPDKRPRAASRTRSHRTATTRMRRHAAEIPKASQGPRQAEIDHGVIRSSRGVSVRVAPSARAALQCVVDYVEAAGVRIAAMRGYGAGTVRASLHPSGRAIDINQTSRDVTSPRVPRSISNAAADKCGVVSGARWGYADNGHWNLAVHGRASQEPWPRVVRKYQ